MEEIKEIEEYITKQIEYSNILLQFIELLTIAKHKDSKIEINKVEPDELKSETSRNLWGVELTINALLSNEGYGKTELILFEEEPKRNNFYEYLKQLILN